MGIRRSPRFDLVLATLIAFSVVGFVGVPASAAAPDQLLALMATPVGAFEGVPYVQYNRIFRGETSTGRSACRIGSRLRQISTRERHGRRRALHFAIGLGALDIYLRRDLLFTRGFARTGIGWSTTSFGPGFDNRILDPTVPGSFIEGSFRRPRRPYRPRDHRRLRPRPRGRSAGRRDTRRRRGTVLDWRLRFFVPGDGPRHVGVRR